MYVGILKLMFEIPWAQSLKDRRSVIRSLAQKLRNEFPVSVAEVDIGNAHQIAKLGISYVASDAKTAEAMMRHISDFAQDHSDAQVSVMESEIILFK